MDILQASKPKDYEKLTMVSEKVTIINAKVFEAWHRIEKHLINPNIIGLAAIQIGIPFRIIGFRPGIYQAIVLLINPEILKIADRPARRQEACMSVDHGRKIYLMSRPKRCKIRGMTIKV